MMKGLMAFVLAGFLATAPALSSEAAEAIGHGNAAPAGHQSTERDLRLREEQHAKDMEARRNAQRKIEMQHEADREAFLMKDRAERRQRSEISRAAARRLEAGISRDQHSISRADLEISPKTAGLLPPAARKGSVPACGEAKALEIFERMTSGRAFASEGDFRGARTPRIYGVYIDLPTQKGGTAELTAVTVKAWTLSGKVAYEVVRLCFDMNGGRFRTLRHERFNACGEKNGELPVPHAWISAKKETVSGDILELLRHRGLVRASRSMYDHCFREMLCGRKAVLQPPVTPPGSRALPHR